MGADNYGIGRMMGNYVASRLKGKGRIVEIKGLRGSSPAIERHRGFLDAIACYPELHIVTACYADWAREKATVRMDSLLREVEHIDCVFGHNDEMAQGRAKPWCVQGADSSVLYVGIDGLPSKGGGLEGRVCQPTIGFVHLSHARRLAFGTGAQHSREETLQKRK